MSTDRLPPLVTGGSPGPGDLPARYGAEEYVVIVVRTGARPLFHRWADGPLAEAPPDADGVYRSTAFPGQWLDPATVLAGDTKRLLDVLTAGLGTAEHAAFAARVGGAGASNRKPMEPVAYQPPVDRPQSRLVWFTIGLAVISAGVAGWRFGVYAGIGLDGVGDAAHPLGRRKPQRSPFVAGDPRHCDRLPTVPRVGETPPLLRDQLVPVKHDHLLQPLLPAHGRRPTQHLLGPG